jgi:hypothetical protein
MRVSRAVGALTVLALGFASGYWTRARWPAAELLGRPAPAARSTPVPGSDGMADEQREKAEALMALGYAAGYDPATGRGGVLTHHAALASPGLNLVVSGHEPSAVLMDMDGHVLHRWHKDFRVAWRNTRLVVQDLARSTFWKRVHLYPNGDLVAMFEGTGLVKLDRNSRVLWTYAGPVHHDLDLDPDGNILVLLKRSHMVPSFDATMPVLEDQIAGVSPTGDRLWGMSILEALLASPYAPLLRFHRPDGGDILHTNTLALLDASQAKAIPGARKGDVLVALRSLDFVGVVSLERKTFVWGLAGVWRQPHEPVLLGNGHLLIFDNYGFRSEDRNYSRALEIDPVTHQVSWFWAGPPRFFSKICGLVQRLPNGNTLITVSTEGRAIEVTPQGKVVWEFLNPHEVTEGGQRKVATLFELRRLSRSEASWLGQ